MDRYHSLKLCNQLCFPLYATSKEIVRKYNQILEEIDLTYTQYITMMLLWEHELLTVKAIGKELYLDSGTLTPVLKKLEAKGYINRNRSKKDERSLEVSITKEGMELRETAIEIPKKMAKAIGLEQSEIDTLSFLLHKVIHNMEQA